MMESIERLNHSLFLAINASAHPPAALLSFAWFSAEVLIYLLAAGLAVSWLRGGSDTRQALIHAGLAATAALLINQLIGLAWYHPRPFEIGLGHTFATHSPETSFPSDHATVFISITLALLRWPKLRAWGALLIPVSLLVAWSRVWLGVHYPLDMLGSLMVAGMVMVTLHRPLLPASKWLSRLGEHMLAKLEMMF